MTCFHCTKIALRHAGTGKRLRGFCGDHTEEAFAYSVLLNKPKVVGFSEYEAGLAPGTTLRSSYKLPYGKHRDIIRHTMF